MGRLEGARGEKGETGLADLAAAGHAWRVAACRGLLKAMSVDMLFPHPRSEAAARLVELAARRRELVSVIADSERAARFASEDRVQAEDALREAERARLSGRGDQATVTRAEKALARAKAEASEPWATRTDAAKLALRERDVEIAGFASEHYEPLRQELAEDAEAAAGGWTRRSRR